MRNVVKVDMKKSIDCFENLVWPVIKENIGGGELITLESVNMDQDLTAKYLDLRCGADYLQVIDGEGTRILASRVQQSFKNWRSFTIRKERATGTTTEYEKLVNALNMGGAIMPYYTVQAYVDKESVIGVGVAKTEDIIDAIKAGKFEERTNPQDGNLFYAVFWHFLPMVYQYSNDA